MQSGEADKKLTVRNKCLEAAMILSLGSRADQQDCFGYALDEKGGLFVICDGMGGYEKGALSAQLATGRMLKDYEAAGSLAEPDVYLKTMAQKANKDICALTDENGRHYRTGTTMVSVIIRDKELYWCSAGDSRAYILRGGSFARITQDHTYMTVLEGQRRCGAIDEEQFQRELSKKELLISFLGVGAELLLDYNSRPFGLECGDRILLTSDGLYKALSEQTVFEVIRETPDQEKALEILDSMAQAAANDMNTGRDNLSAVLIKVI